LTAKELGEEFELEVVLQHGSLAGIYFDTAEHRVQKLRAYVETYLREEIAQEGLVRNYDVFNRFLDLAAAYPTELLSYTNIAKSANTNGKTIQNYYSILYETLIAFELPSWDRSVRKQLARHPKFYFCDNGINNAICSLLRDPLSLSY
jgi:predicted AAA+ superfamily ATPase